jgi:hypothetical protein
VSSGGGFLVAATPAGHRDVALPRWDRAGMSTPVETKRSNPARIAAFVGGGVIGLLGLILLAAGGVGLWANGQKDDDGYLATGSDRFATSTYALATESLDVDSHGAGWLIDSDRYGKVRLKATSRTSKPVFVGIARTSAVTRYLRDAAHATVTDVEYSPFRAEYRTQRAGGAPALPADQRFWVASAHGPGQQTLKWNVEHGAWSVVVMNADGSRGVDAGVSAGANVPILPVIGWGALGVGLVLLVATGGLVAVGVRSR